MFFLRSGLKLLLYGLLFIFAGSVYGQMDMAEEIAIETERVSTMSAPVAVPVLTQKEAHQKNEEALNDYQHDSMVEGEKTSHKNTLYIASVFFAILLFAFGFYLYRKIANVFHLTASNANTKDSPAQMNSRRIKDSFLRFYRSPFGRMFYCTRLCGRDWICVLVVFGITFFFSMLTGEKAARNSYNGNWYAEKAAPIALSIYNTGEVNGLVAAPDSKLDNFLKKGSKGDLDYSSITNEEAVPRKYTGPSTYLDSTGIAWLIAWWWKLIGHPDWSTLYILFSLFYGLIAVAAYFALRQITGLIPSTVLCLLLSSYPTMMNQVLFRIRDGARALFCFIAIAILLYLLKGGFRWKGTIVSSIFLFVICSLSTYFRSDFTVLIPFIVIAAVFFHGKVLANYKKKTTIVLSIILGLIVSRTLPGTLNERFGMGHVLYIGMADHPFMDYLHFSADNYTKGISYSDKYGFIVAAGKAYRDRGELNLPRYTEPYDQELKKEIFGLAELYPHDFLRLALSSSIQSLHIGSSLANKKLEWIDSAPGYWMFQEQSKGFFQWVPSWFYLVLFSVMLLLFLCGSFYNSLFLCIAFMPMSAVYMLQFDIRHYFYLMLLSLLLAGFVFDRLFRLIFILLKNRNKVWSLVCYRRKKILLHASVLAGLTVLAFGVLFVANLIQVHQVKNEISNFGVAATEALDFKTNQVPSKIKKKISAVEVLFPELYKDTLARENPQQNTFTDFLKVKFRVIGAENEEKIIAFAKYENADEYKMGGLSVGGIINQTWTCPIPLSFSAGKDSNTLYMPVYYSRTSSPFVGIELVAEDGKEISVESVERIAETNNIRTQSAFLVPEKMEDMKYAGNMDWGKVFFGK